MKLPYDLCVIDLESNGPSGPIIEIGATVLTRKGIILGEYQQFVKISEALKPEITELTGITEENLSVGGLPFVAALEGFVKWIQKELGTKNFLIASWSNWDTATLRKECEQCNIEYPFRGKTLDVKSVVLWMSYLMDRDVHGEGLGNMLECWDLKFVGSPHSARCDAKNTAILLKTVWEYYDKRSDILLTTIRELGLAK